MTERCDESRPILLVEDNPDDVELTLYALEESAVCNPVVVARNGAEALSRLFGDGGVPALVLLDLQLPRVGGVEVLRRIREDARTRLLPVIVLTSSGEERDLVDCYRLGANSYVRKPVDFDEFRDAARQLSHYWLRINHPPPVVERFS